MRIEETYNIHKKINCVFPFFKSKWLCKKGVHNYQIISKIISIPMVSYIERGTKKISYQRVFEKYWKCKCCGKEEKFEN